MHCLTISICDTKIEFNGGTKEKYHLVNHRKELEKKYLNY